MFKHILLLVAVFVLTTFLFGAVREYARQWQSHQANMGARACINFCNFRFDFLYLSASK